MSEIGVSAENPAGTIRVSAEELHRRAMRPRLVAVFPDLELEEPLFGIKVGYEQRAT